MLMICMHTVHIQILRTFFSVALLTHHGQGNLQKEDGFICSYSSKGILSQQGDAAAGGMAEVQTRRSELTSAFSEVKPAKTPKMRWPANGEPSVHMLEPVGAIHIQASLAKFERNRTSYMWSGFIAWASVCS